MDEKSDTPMPTPITVDVHIKVKKEWKPVIVTAFLFVVGVVIGFKIGESKHG